MEAAGLLLLLGWLCWELGQAVDEALGFGFFGGGGFFLLGVFGEGHRSGELGSVFLWGSAQGFGLLEAELGLVVFWGLLLLFGFWWFGLGFVLGFGEEGFGWNAFCGLGDLGLLDLLEFEVGKHIALWLLIEVLEFLAEHLSVLETDHTIAVPSESRRPF